MVSRTWHALVWRCYSALRLGAGAQGREEHVNWPAGHQETACLLRQCTAAPGAKSLTAAFDRLTVEWDADEVEEDAALLPHPEQAALLPLLAARLSALEHLELVTGTPGYETVELLPPVRDRLAGALCFA